MRFRASIAVLVGDKQIGHIEFSDADLGRLLLALPVAAERVADGLIFNALSALTPENYGADDD